eukprot:130557-Prorocentrum_minimum.AAC.4
MEEVRVRQWCGLLVGNGTFNGAFETGSFCETHFLMKLLLGYHRYGNIIYFKRKVIRFAARVHHRRPLAHVVEIAHPVLKVRAVHAALDLPEHRVAAEPPGGGPATLAGCPEGAEAGGALRVVELAPGQPQQHAAHQPVAQPNVPPHRVRHWRAVGGELSADRVPHEGGGRFVLRAVALAPPPAPLPREQPARCRRCHRRRLLGAALPPRRSFASAPGGGRGSRRRRASRGGGAVGVA